MSSVQVTADAQQKAQAGNYSLLGAALISLPLVLVALLYFPSFRTLAHNWVDFDNLGYTHGWLIVACVIWLIYEVAKESPLVVVQPSARGCAVLALTSLLWLLTFAANLQLAQHMMLPLLVLGSIFALFGYEAARRYLFPITYLYFAIGFWGALNPILQWGTVYAMRVLLRVFAVPVYFEGNIIHLPSGPIAVEGACSGLNFFVVAIAIAAFYGSINRIKRRVLLIALAAVFAIFANWVRVLTIVIAGHLTNMQHYLITVEHIRFGWVVFGVMMLGYLMVASKLESSETQVNEESPATHKQLKLSALALFALAVSIGPAWSAFSQIASKRMQVELSLLKIAPNWIEHTQTLTSQISSWRPMFIGANTLGVRSFQSGDQKVEAFEALYKGQSQSAKLAGYDNSLFGVLQVLSKERLASGMQQSVLKDENGDRWLIRYAYIAGERIFDKPIAAQIAAGLGSLVKPTRAAVVAMRARCSSDCNEAKSALDQFALDLSRN